MKLYKILLVENDQNTSDLISLVLKSAGYECGIVSSGADAFEMIKTAVNEKDPYDMILLDIMLDDGISGHKVLQDVRKLGIDIPVLILSGLGDYKNKLKGFDLGADDVLIKPFNRQELIARIKAIKRRSHGVKGPIINITDRISVDIESAVIEIDNKIFSVTGTEYNIIAMFAKKTGKIISKSALFEFLYPAVKDEPGSIKIIDVYICKLRNKISKALGESKIGKDIIQTIWGRGYMIKSFNKINAIYTKTDTLKDDQNNIDTDTLIKSKADKVNNSLMKNIETVSVTV